MYAAPVHIPYSYTIPNSFSFISLLSFENKTMKTLLKLTLTTLFLCFFLTFSLSGADEQNKMEIYKCLQQRAIDSLISTDSMIESLSIESLSTQQQTAFSDLKKLIAATIDKLQKNSRLDTKEISNVVDDIQRIEDSIMVLTSELVAQFTDLVVKLKALDLKDNIVGNIVCKN